VVASSLDIQQPPSEGAFVDGDKTKLDGIEAGADVTDTANVTAAGALMDSELTSEASVKALDQGVSTTDSPDFAGLTVDTNTLYVDSSNSRVGIGTSSPARLLELSSTDNTSIIRLSDASSALNDDELGKIEWYSGDGDEPGVKGSIYTTTYSDARGGVMHFDVDGSASGASYFQWDIRGSEAMRIDSSGRVGIGTSSPEDELEVSSALPIIRLTDSDTSAYGRVASTDGDLLLQADRGNTAASSNIRFDIDASEAMRIASSGRVLVGTTNTFPGLNNTDPGVSLSRGGSFMSRDGASTPLFLNQNQDGSILRFYRSGSQVGSVSVTSSSTSYNTSSDERLKENIADAQPASDLIDGIQVREFDWKADGEHQRYGMVAQELETVAPEAVTKGETDEDMWSVDYSKLVPMLVKEIQDLRKRVNELENT